jgi:hypothetical protein
MLLCIALSTADSFGISLIPASPRGKNRCAIEVQINMAIPPKIPARRIFISGRMTGWGGIEKENLAPEKVATVKPQQSSQLTSILRNGSGPALGS